MGEGRLLELLTKKAATCSIPVILCQLIVPCTKGLALILLTICPLAGAATYRVRAGADSSMIQRVVRRASSGDTVSFEAGTYPVTSTITLKCGITYTGPVANPATAKITTSRPNISLFGMSGGCSSGTTTIQYLDFNGAGPAYFDASNYSNINFLHNQVTNMPYSSSCSGPCTSLYFDGNNSNTDSNITIEYNTFGDGNSCVAGESIDEGGCAGILTATVGFLVNMTIKYNSFIHLNEGMHFQNTNYCAGCTSAVGENLDIEYNYFNQINRIPLENQVGDISAPQIMSNNVIANNRTTGTPYATIAISSACCFNGRNFSTVSDQNPTNYVQNNLVFQSIGNATTLAAPLALEIAGVNPQTTNNLVQGYYCYGVSWSWSGSAGGRVDNNTLQSPIAASGGSNSQCKGGPSSYLSSECGTFCGTPPSYVGNVHGSTPSAVTSVAPTISPASGSQPFPLTVTLSDPGYTSGSVPRGNTGIWYTTDGSTPVPGSGTAQYLASGGTFVLSAPATVKAVGMWGTPNQPTRYPAGYGFVPSAVKSAHYTSRVANQQP